MNRLFCIVAPSGSGKTTLARGLAAAGVPEVLSTTSRKPRAGEVDGQHYHFVSAEAFEDLIYRGSMLEHVTYGGNRYGTTKIAVANLLLEGSACIVVESGGAKQIKAALGTVAQVIFLSPPRTDELRRRMLERGDAPDSVEARLQSVGAEVDAGLSVADHVIFPVPEETLLRHALQIVDAG